jgi:hypothetical protein
MIFFHDSFWGIYPQMLFDAIFGFFLCAIQRQIALSQRNPSFSGLLLLLIFDSIRKTLGSALWNSFIKIKILSSVSNLQAFFLLTNLAASRIWFGWNWGIPMPTSVPFTVWIRLFPV